MSALRFVAILLGAFRKEAQGIVNLAEVPGGEYADYWFYNHENALRKAQEDAQCALRAEERGAWGIARVWWCRAASRHLARSDAFVLYLMAAEKAANQGQDPPGWS